MVRNGLTSVAIFSLFCTSALTGAAAWAQETQETSPLTGIYACADIVDDAARLACFDGAVKSLKSAEETGQFVTVDGKKVKNLERNAFGFNLPNLPKLRLGLFNKKNADGTKIARQPVLENEDPTQGQVLKRSKKGDIMKIGLLIDHVKKRPDGSVRFYLKNGQVWVQTDSQRVWMPKKGEAIAHIYKKAMGSFFLRVNGRGLAIRVRREK